MPLSGDFSALKEYLRRLNRLSEAGQQIANAMAPTISGLVKESFTSQASPNGIAWPPTKSGKPAFGGSEALGYTFTAVKKKNITTAVLYPLHFHHAGTKKIGKKRGRKIKAKAMAMERKLVTSAIRPPAKRKNETQEQYAARLVAIREKRALRAEIFKSYEASAKRRAEEAFQAARAAGGWHDPPRPAIPEQDAPIPATWEKPIQATAARVMAEYGATPK